MCENLGKRFRPAYLELTFLCTLSRPSVLIMALSATVPPSLEFLVARNIGLRKPYFHVSQPLNCPNIVFSVKRKQCLFVELSSVI